MYSLPKFISFASYNIGTSNSKTILVNERTLLGLQLDGLSSDFWFYLFSNDKKVFYEFIKNNNLENDVDSFISSLLEYGFIYLTNEFVDDSVPSSCINQNNDDLIQFENEFDDWLTKNNFLGRLFFELTHKCNLNCIHCFQQKDDIKQDISLIQFKNIIDQAVDLGLYSITLSGGECTLNNDFLERRIKMISLNWVKDYISLLNSIIEEFPHSIYLSLYSMNPSIHDAITGVNGSHYKTLSVINYLIKKNVFVGIKCFLLKDNIQSHEDVLKFAQENKIVVTTDSSFLFNHKRNNFDIQASDEQLLNCFLDDNSLLFAGSIQPLILNQEFQNRKICKGGQTSLAIYPNLDVSFCSSFSFVLGNLKNSSLNDIFNGDLNISYRSKKINQLISCFKEEYCKFCVYCPGFAIMEGRYLDKSESLCRLAKLKYKAYEKIKNS